MRYKILNAIAIVVGLYLFSAQTALAAPMLCSGEQKNLHLCLPEKSSRFDWGLHCQLPHPVQLLPANGLLG